MTVVNADNSIDTKRTETLIAAYSEVCKSYNAIDEFRMKLLGLLPLSSLVGIFFLNRENMVMEQSVMAQELIGFAGVFAFLLAVALFLYEIRGILKCDHLTTRGIDLEEKLQVQGQFITCSIESARAKKLKLDSLFSDRLASCIIYSGTIAAWLFVFLRFGVGFEFFSCIISTTIFGLLLTIGSYILIESLLKTRRL